MNNRISLNVVVW